MFVRIRVETNYCGEWDEGVYEFPDDTTEKDIELYASELADENALSFEEPIEPDDEDESREAYYEWEKLEETREQILKDWGEIHSI